MCKVAILVVIFAATPANLMTASTSHMVAATIFLNAMLATTTRACVFPHPELVLYIVPFTLLLWFTITIRMFQTMEIAELDLAVLTCQVGPVRLAIRHMLATGTPKWLRQPKKKKPPHTHGNKQKKVVVNRWCEWANVLFINHLSE
eukprot:m.29205 g.29205  ORF g.29205 m.29205 type:complete len:146 (+) comp10513_c1_seq3:2975-3412(+)